jgi:hypothetical protein
MFSLNIKRKVTDSKEQLEAVLNLLRFPFTSVEVSQSNAKVNTKIDLPKEILPALEKDLKRLTSLDVQIIADAKKE